MSEAPVVLLTGATGFVGSSLARALVASGAIVHALARPGSDRARVADLPLVWHEGDVLEPASLTRDLFAVDWVVHAAGRLGQAGVPEPVYHRLHVEGTRRVLAACLASGRPERILYLSSPGVLGPIAGPPADETAPLAPSNAYERSKAAAEAVAQEYAAAGLPVITARPEFIYGPGDRHVLGLFQAVNRGLFFYVDGGRHVCHPTYIEDAVNGLLLCLRRGRPGGIYHLAGPRPVTFRQLGTAMARALGRRPPWLSLPRRLAMAGATAAELILGVIGQEAPLSRAGVAFFSEDRRFSWQLAHRELGYEPGVDLTTGLDRTVRWYRDQGWLA